MITSGDDRVIYLDNSATTKVFESTARVAMHYMTTEHFNPSSMYAPAVAVEREVERVRCEMATYIGAQSDELYFTSGGTESDNIAILGVLASLRKGRYRFVTTEMEHPAVYAVFAGLEKAGQEVVYLRPDNRGHISKEQLEDAVDESTALVSIMHVNNEIGSVQDLFALSDAIKERNPNAYFHSDGVQAFCKLKRCRLPVDMYSISGHKFHAPKGVGAVMIKKRVKNSGGFIGGGQERNMRSGTVNAPGILAMGDAFAVMRDSLDANCEHMMRLKLQLASYLMQIPDVCVNGPEPETGAPHILNVSFMGVRGEVLLHALEGRGIMVSTGSACSSHKKGKNRVLASVGIEGARAESAIRFSLSPLNTEREMAITAETIDELVKSLRRFKRR